MMRVFVSSVQKEFAEERKALGDFLKGDPMLRRFFEVFLFEDAPAADHRADEVYLDEVGRCDIYIGLFGDEYGWEDADGMSPTQLEFREATRLGKTRLIFVKGATDQAEDFILSKINLPVGTRKESAQVPVAYEILKMLCARHWRLCRLKAIFWLT